MEPLLNKKISKKFWTMCNAILAYLQSQDPSFRAPVSSLFEFSKFSNFFYAVSRIALNSSVPLVDIIGREFQFLGINYSFGNFTEPTKFPLPFNITKTKFMKAFQENFSFLSDIVFHNRLRRI